MVKANIVAMDANALPDLTLGDDEPLRTPEQVRQLFRQSNSTIIAWSRANGVRYHLAAGVAGGRITSKTGKARKVAELLGMARPSTAPAEPNLNIDLKPAKAEPLRTPEEVRAMFRERNITTSGWASFHGFSPVLVRRVLTGNSKGLRGECRDIAIKLGIEREQLAETGLNLVPDMDAPLRTPDEVRSLLMQSGQTLTGWARANGFDEALTRIVVTGKRVCVRGQSYRIAVALGLQRGIDQDP